MKKIIGLLFGFFLLFIFLLQAQSALAGKGKNNHPITSPITSPRCKPGWGFGDKNHCHFGPPGKHTNQGNRHDSDDTDHGTRHE